MVGTAAVTQELAHLLGVTSFLRQRCLGQALHQYPAPPVASWWAVGCVSVPGLVWLALGYSTLADFAITQNLPASADNLFASCTCHFPHYMADPLLTTSGCLQPVLPLVLRLPGPLAMCSMLRPLVLQT